MFRVWLEDRMKSTVSHLDLEVFNKTLCAMIVQRAASAGGLTRDVSALIFVAMVLM